MKLVNKSGILALSLGLLGIVWCLSIFAIRDIGDNTVSAWGGIIGGIFAIVIAEIYLLMFKKNPGKQAVEIGAVAIYCTVIYFVVAVAINSVFILTQHGDFNWSILTVNALLDVVYVILILYVEKDTERIQRQLNNTEHKHSIADEFSRKLGELLGLAEDDAVRRQLIKLKEMMDYSTNISTYATSAADEKMEAQLNEIMQLMANKADNKMILNKLCAAEATWKIRSSNASSVR